MADRRKGDWNGWVGVVLGEARRDLVGALAALSEGGPGGSDEPKAGGQPSGEPVDRMIDKILQGK